MTQPNHEVIEDPPELEVFQEELKRIQINLLNNLCQAQIDLNHNAGVEKYTDRNLVWDKQMHGYRKPQNFQLEWSKYGCVFCPRCNEFLSEEDYEELTCCNYCGYDFR